MSAGPLFGGNGPIQQGAQQAIKNGFQAHPVLGVAALVTAGAVLLAAKAIDSMSGDKSAAGQNSSGQGGKSAS